MEATDILRDIFGRSRKAIAPLLELSDAELYVEPLPSIAWHAWRMGRLLDYNISGLMQTGQLWTDEHWHLRFDMGPELEDFLPGFPPPNDIVWTFHSASAQLLLDYFDAAFERTMGYIATLSAADLDRVLGEPQYGTPPTVSVRLVSVGVALAQSSGPIRYRLWFASNS